MAKLKIAIVISTTRAARFGHKPAQWVHDIAAQRRRHRDRNPRFARLPDAVLRQGRRMPGRPRRIRSLNRWQKKVAEFDGFIFVTAEYNRCDSGGAEERPRLGLSGMGQEGRRIRRLRSSAARARRALAPGRGRAANGNHPHRRPYPGRRRSWRCGGRAMQLKGIADLETGVNDMLDQLVWWTRALKTARDQDKLAAAVRDRTRNRKPFGAINERQASCPSVR